MYDNMYIIHFGGAKFLLFLPHCWVSFVMSGIKEIMQTDMPQDTSVFILVQDNITICESYAGFL